jgi:nitroreductase
MKKELSRREFLKVSTAAGAVLATGSAIVPIVPSGPAVPLVEEACKDCGDDLNPIPVTRPAASGNHPLLQLLMKRSSSRSFSPEPLPKEVLSNLVWAAFGINRPDSGRRTAPSASNRQEIDLFVAMAEGLYVFDAKAGFLVPLVAEDIRARTGRQPFVKEAPVNLVYVADFSRMGAAAREDQEFYSAADAGFISENVYLFCAAEGLATVVRGLIDRPALAKAMGLRPDQKILLAQSVGYPRKE